MIAGFCSKPDPLSGAGTNSLAHRRNLRAIRRSCDVEPSVPRVACTYGWARPSDTTQLRVLEAHLGEGHVERRRSVDGHAQPVPVGCHVVEQLVEDGAALLFGGVLPEFAEVHRFEDLGELFEAGGDVVGVGLLHGSGVWPRVRGSRSAR